VEASSCIFCFLVNYCLFNNIRQQSGESKYNTLRSLKTSLGWKEKGSGGGFKLFGKSKPSQPAKAQATVNNNTHIEEDFR
jgi:hypothetical protein